MSIPDDDFLLAAVDAKLKAIAAASENPPVWFDDWMRLKSDSPVQMRLAVHQAIRDSGCLPDEAGLCLVSWCIESLADLEAETSLRHLNDRMDAIEKVYESEKGRAWPIDQVPEEFQELSLQYQNAWDELFISKLADCGEQEMANLCSTATEQFDRYYEIGLQYLLGPIVVNRAVSPDELIRVTSCLDVPHADLARLALSAEGIRASLGNATFLSWFWHYSNAVGGVTVHVRNEDAKRAREVLAAGHSKPLTSLPPWICNSCGQRIAGQWEVCWRCGQLPDGAVGSPPIEYSEQQPEGDAGAEMWLNGSRLFTAGVVVLLIMLLLRYGWSPALILAPIAVIIIFLLRQFEASATLEPQTSEAGKESQEPSDPSSHDHSTTRSELSKAIVRRAWHAAVFALSFPPLGFYSMRLLWKLGQRNTPLSLADSWRCWAAFILNIVNILACLAFAMMVLFGFFGAFFRHGR